MKPLLLAILCSICIKASSQVLEENKVDDFTKTSVKRTSWEPLIYNMSKTCYFRISKLDKLYYFDFKLTLGGKVFSIAENDKLMFKLDNDSIYSLSNLKYAITQTGGGAIGFAGSAQQGIQTSYVDPVTSNFDILKTQKVVKIRIYTSGGFIEEDLKPKYGDCIMKAVSIVD